MTEKRYEEVSLQEIVIAYPYLEEFLATNDYAYIYEDRRLFSVEERAQMFGGKAFVLENLKQIKGKSRRFETMILQAARPDIIATTQTWQYAEYLQLGGMDNMGLILSLLCTLEENGDLNREEKKVRGFSRHGDIYHAFERDGFRTSTQGRRTFNDLFANVKGTLPDLGGFEPA